MLGWAVLWAWSGWGRGRYRGRSGVYRARADERGDDSPVCDGWMGGGFVTAAKLCEMSPSLVDNLI